MLNEAKARFAGKSKPILAVRVRLKALPGKPHPMEKTHVRSGLSLATAPQKLPPFACIAATGWAWDSRCRAGSNVLDPFRWHSHGSRPSSWRRWRRRSEAPPSLNVEDRLHAIRSKDHSPQKPNEPSRRRARPVLSLAPAFQRERWNTEHCAQVPLRKGLAKLCQHRVELGIGGPKHKNQPARESSFRHSHTGKPIALPP